MSEETVIIFSAPIIEKPEYRLYYDEEGNVICYTCDKLPGNYIIIDAQTFAEGRPDYKVIDGTLRKINLSTYVSKLVPVDNGTVTCAIDDVTIIVEEKSNNTQDWILKTYELR